MKISTQTLIYALIGIAVTMTWIGFVRPVGWFDSVFGCALGLAIFFALKKFEGFE